MLKRLFAAVALLCVSVGVSAQVSVAPILQPHVTFVDASGSPCVGCQLFSYVAGTSIPQPTYTDASGTIPNPNPVVLSVQGGSNIWVDKSVAYKFVLKSPTGVTIWSVDYVESVGNTSIVSDPSTTQTIIQPPGTNFIINTSAGGKFTYNGSEVVTSASGVIKLPTISQIVTQPAGTTLSVNNFNSVQYVRDGDNLATLCSNFTSSTGQLIVSSPMNVSASVTVPATCGMIVYEGGSVTVASGQTLTISGPFAAPPRQVFFGSGSVTGLSEVRPEWFGTSTTIADAAGKLAPGISGTILLGANRIPAGNSIITRSNTSIIGIGQALYNAGNTAFATGTGSIVVGNLAINASNVTVKNLSVDVGSDQGSCNNGLTISGGVIATPIADITVDHVSTLLCNAASAFHSVLVENVIRATVSNVETRYGIYGLVLKCQRCSVSHIESSGHGTNCGIIKSDNQFGVSLAINLHDIRCRSISANDTGPFNIDGFGTVTSEITLDGFNALGTKSGILLSARNDGTNNGAIADTIITNTLCDTLGSSACILFQSDASNHIDRTLISNLVANNIAVDAIATTSGSTGISIIGGTFTNISGAGYPIDNAAEGTIATNIHCYNNTNACIYANQFHMMASDVLATGPGPSTGVGLGAIAYSQFDGVQNTINFNRISIGTGVPLSDSNVIPIAGTSPAGQAACIKATGPPVVIGYCSVTVSGSGACTCN